MTSRERLLALLHGEPTDRIGVHVLGVRPWTPWWMAGRGSHPSYAPLVEAVRTRADVLSPIGFETGFYHSAAPVRTTEFVEDVPGHPDIEHHVTVVEAPHGLLRSVVAMHKIEREPMPLEHFVKTPDDLENLLAIPYAPVRPEVAPMLERDRQLGDRGLVLIGIGSDPVGMVHSLLGTERLALWSIEHRELLHRALGEFLRRLLDMIHHFNASGIHDHMPVVFFHTGAEIVAPPIHSPADFREFCLKYDGELHAAIHEAGGYIRVHCHGSLSAVLEDLADAGVDILQPVEPPPEGNVVLADAKRRIGDRLVIEGNVQFSRLSGDEPASFRRLVEQTVAEGKPGGRFILCPTASPYAAELNPRMLANYLTLIDVALTEGRYG